MKFKYSPAICRHPPILAGYCRRETYSMLRTMNKIIFHPSHGCSVTCDWITMWDVSSGSALEHNHVELNYYKSVNSDIFGMRPI